MNITIRGSFYKTNTGSIGIKETLLSRLFYLSSYFPNLFNLIKFLIVKKYFIPSKKKVSLKKITCYKVNSEIDIQIPKDLRS